MINHSENTVMMMMMTPWTVLWVLSPWQSLRALSRFIR